MRFLESKVELNVKYLLFQKKQVIEKSWLELSFKQWSKREKGARNNKLIFKESKLPIFLFLYLSTLHEISVPFNEYNSAPWSQCIKLISGFKQNKDNLFYKLNTEFHAPQKRHFIGCWFHAVNILNDLFKFLRNEIETSNSKKLEFTPSWT